MKRTLTLCLLFAMPLVATRGERLQYFPENNDPYQIHFEKDVNKELFAELDKVDQALRDENISEALHLMGKVLELNPTAWPVHQQMANIYYSLGRFEAAIKHTEAIIKANPNAYHTFMLHGDCLTYLKRFQESALAYREALEIKPGDAQASRKLALTMSLSGQLDEAMAVFKEELRKSPSATPVMEQLGLLAGQQGRLEDAVQYYRDALVINPNSANAHNKLAVFLSGLGRLKEAVEHVKLAIELKPDMPDAHNNLGFLHVRMGKLREALPHFRKAIELKPDYAAAQVNIATALANLYEDEEAARHFREAIKLTPKNSNLYTMLGSLNMRQGKLADAEKEFEAARKLERKDPLTYYYSGLTSYMRGDHVASVAHYRRALEYRPAFFLVMNNLAWMLATSPVEEVKNVEEAITLAEQACAQTRNLAPGALDTLATTYAAAGRFTKAYEVATNAVRIARDQKNVPLVEAITIHAALYKEGKPFVDELPEKVPE